MELPDLIYLNDYNGDFEAFLNFAYSVFEQDFKFQSNTFLSYPLKIKEYPLEEGMHRTFYHITHKGPNEQNRMPDLRRIERIRFPKPIIKYGEIKDQDLLVWKNERFGKGGRKKNILIMHKEERYIVILREKKDYYMLVTAYLIDRESRYNDLLNEAKRYLKRTKRV